MGDRDALRARSRPACVLPALAVFATAGRELADASGQAFFERAHQGPLDSSESRLDPVGGFPRDVDAAQEFLQLSSGYQIAAFLLQVFGDVFAGDAPRAPGPGPDAPGNLPQAPRRHVAYEARQLLFQVGTRRCKQLAV